MAGPSRLGPGRRARPSPSRSPFRIPRGRHRRGSGSASVAPGLTWLPPDRIGPAAWSSRGPASCRSARGATSSAREVAAGPTAITPGSIHLGWSSPLLHRRHRRHRRPRRRLRPRRPRRSRHQNQHRNRRLRRHQSRPPSRRRDGPRPSRRPSRQRSRPPRLQSPRPNPLPSLPRRPRSHAPPSRTFARPSRPRRPPLRQTSRHERPSAGPLGAADRQAAAGTMDRPRSGLSSGSWP